MSSTPDTDTDADVETLLTFTVQTQEFVDKLLDEAKARNFCPACALNFVAQLLRAASAIAPHEGEGPTSFPSTDFDDTPGHG